MARNRVSAGMWLKLRTAVKTDTIPRLRQNINNIDDHHHQNSDAEQGEVHSVSSPPHPPAPSLQPSTTPDIEDGASSQARTHQCADGSGNDTSQPEGTDGTRSSSDALKKLQRRVRIFFMDPWSKFKARQGHYVPAKLFVQIIKIGLITAQMVQFGKQRSEIVEFFDRTETALDHLLLKGWDASYETMPYPPATGEFAVYTVDDLLDHLEYTWEQYYNLSHSSLAEMNPVIDNSTGKPFPIRLCTRFNKYTDFHNGTYIVWPGAENDCKDLVPMEKPDEYNIRTFLGNITFSKLLDLTLSFTFTTFHLNLVETHYGPTCFKVNATILYKNVKRSGQLQISLATHNRERECTGRILSDAVKEEEEAVIRRNLTLDSFVIIFCVASFVLCVRSSVLAFKLLREVESNLKKKLGYADRMQFCNLWYILILVNDIFTISAAIFKIGLGTRVISSSSENFNACSILLGLGGLMAWIGCLRYLEFFRGYGVLILTLKSAFPNVLRFMICAFVMYLGFLFCGWLVLGPYHVKFRELYTTSESLYSLINGDDMFVTFTATMTEDQGLWLFSRVYLYTFISLYVFCVLSLFISVFTDTYETLKNHFKEGFPKTELHRFLEQADDDGDDLRYTLSCCKTCKCKCNDQSEEPTEQRARV